MRFDDLPYLLDNYQDFEKQLTDKKLAVFFDYDGTLTPIVSNPEDAILTEEMRKKLHHLSTLCTVAIISGRDRADVANLVALKDLVYSGSHGFDISGPDFEMKHEAGQSCLPEFDKAESQLRSQLSDIPNAKVERKLFAIATHYRNVAEDDVHKVETIVDDVLSQYDCFKKAGGKKIIEFKPDIEWHKGRALLWLLNKLSLTGDKILPLYIGDDFTDEDAFIALQEVRGVGILVGDHGTETSAQYRLKDPEEVEQFVEKLIDHLG